MKYFTSHAALPKSAVYLGSEDGPGESSEALEDALNDAQALGFVIDDGVYSYFDLGAS